MNEIKKLTDKLVWRERTPKIAKRYLYQFRTPKKEVLNYTILNVCIRPIKCGYKGK